MVLRHAIFHLLPIAYPQGSTSDAIKKLYPNPTNKINTAIAVLMTGFEKKLSASDLGLSRTVVREMATSKLVHIVK
jgi:hypothetical protein